MSVEQPSESQLDSISAPLAAEAYCRRIEGVAASLRDRSAQLEGLLHRLQATSEAIEARLAGANEYATKGGAHDEVIRLRGALASAEADVKSRDGELRRLNDEVTFLRAAVGKFPWRRLAAKVARRMGVKNVRPDAADPPESVAFKAMSTERALERIGNRGVEVATVIDVGASNGMWSEVCERRWPNARYLLVEAQTVHRASLERYCAARKNAEFVLAAAGRERGEIWFDDADPFGGVASDKKTAGAKTRLPVTTLDHEVAERKLRGPYLLKLDVHGYELPILDAATTVLANASLVVIECYSFRIAEQSLLFHEMVAWMRERGFGVVDMSEPLWRFRDACLWQMDFFFAPLSRPELNVHTWQ